MLVTGGLVPSSWITGTAFNLTVEDLHTYFVVIADEGILVHNCPLGPRGDMTPAVKAGNVKKIGDDQIESIVGDAHAFKEDVLGPGSPVSKFDIGVGPDGMIYLINKSTKVLVETGVRAGG